MYGEWGSGKGVRTVVQLCVGGKVRGRTRYRCPTRSCGRGFAGQSLYRQYVDVYEEYREVKVE